LHSAENSCNLEAQGGKSVQEGDMQEALKVPLGPADESCDSRVLLNQIAPGCEDKLHNKIKEILWRGANYAIYCSDKGIYVHFSDCKEEEEDQRK
jgi:hypothetical protein